MQSEWMLRPLSEVAREITVGFVGTMADQYVDEGVPFLRSLNVRPLQIDTSDVKYISRDFHDRLRKSALRPGDVVIVRTGKPGTCAVIPETLPEANCSDVVIVRCAQQLRPAFLSYWVNAMAASHVSAHTVGAVQQHFNVASAKLLRLPVPPLAVQDSVLAPLLAIDQRIDLLRQTNATLESIAQALFKSWFIDFDPVHAKAEGREPEGMDAATAALFPAEFEESALGLIPKGWSPGKLEVICSNPRAQAKPGQMPPETPYIGLEHMPRKSIALGDAGTAEGLGSGKFWFERNDVLFGKLRPYFHKVGLAPVRGVCSTDILVLRPRSPGWLGFLAMHASSDALISYTTQLSNGARMPRTSWHDVGGFDVTLPPHTVASAFDAAVKPMFERIHANIESAQLLAGLRDTLLPRLISGKLRLPEQAPLEDALA
ncbi:restriction endonuclease subunit S [Ideonella sp. B7]|uniref:restriction endonuclease subunit S n=1 Tax=Ideonella benzenivorans TaxID=2831643 RepID=UPI004046FA72|nr:restriction endonuclease subunit S [Ideonella benzenivorans]